MTSFTEVADEVACFDLRPGKGEIPLTFRADPRPLFEVVAEVLGLPKLIVVATGGHDEAERTREHWNDGNNVRALRPGVVMGCDRNDDTNAALRAAGIELLLDAGVVVICAAGSGIPVIRHANGSLIGVKAVVDKDASSALLARSLRADALLLLTDVGAVDRDFGTPDAESVPQVSPEVARKLVAPDGLTAPKLRAAAEFANGGGIAAIGRLAETAQLLSQNAGTIIATTRK